MKLQSMPNPTYLVTLTFYILDQQPTYPWNETLVEARNATTTPDGLNSLEHGLLPVCSHLGLEDL